MTDELRPESGHTPQHDCTLRDEQLIARDISTLERLGYQQELQRRMSGFSNFAISMSIICILAGGVTSFSQGFCSVGGASIGLGWPLVCVFSLIVAATMGQVASAFPTAGGLYHWAAILGGRGWGWVTAWFNLAGLVSVLAAINVGLVEFVSGVLERPFTRAELAIGVATVTVAQAIFNHRGIRVTTLLTDFSGYWILAVSAILTGALLTAVFVGDGPDWSRLVEFRNFSGEAGGKTWPPTENVGWLFLLGLLLPAYTLTGFDASAHVAEETIGAAERVPLAIVRSVLVSGVAGWLLLVAVVLAMPDVTSAAAQDGRAFVWTLNQALPEVLVRPLLWCIVVAQFLCGLATVTSASRMMFAFARDGGLPGSAYLRWVSPAHGTPVWSIWLTASLTIVLTSSVPYATIAAVCAVLLYISYVLPTALGAVTFGRTWTRFGPWNLGRWYRPLAVVAVVGCVGLLVIGAQPPNHQAITILGGILIALAVCWIGWERDRFQGPPAALLDAERLNNHPVSPV